MNDTTSTRPGDAADTLLHSPLQHSTGTVLLAETDIGFPVIPIREPPISFKVGPDIGNSTSVTLILLALAIE